MAGAVAISDVVEAFDEPVLLMQAERTIAANSAARDLLGENIVGRDIRLALRHPQGLEAALNGDFANVDIVGLAGSDRPWRVAIRPLRGSGTLIRLLDRSDALAAERMRVDFVANASHELRTPLATVSGFAETLADEGEIDEETRRRFAGTMSTEAKRMLRIIEDLMSLSRIEADRFVVPREEIDLLAIAEQAVEQIKLLADDKNATIVLDAQGSERFPILGDSAQLLQAIDNLLSNAIRYGTDKENPLVELKLRRDGEMYAVEVIDHGPGVDANHLPRLTQRFYRVDDARSRKSGGTGLGLAIVKHIVERHRGNMEIRSRPGEGTVVRIAIPNADSGAL